MRLFGLTPAQAHSLLDALQGALAVRIRTGFGVDDDRQSCGLRRDQGEPNAADDAGEAMILQVGISSENAELMLDVLRDAIGRDMRLVIEWGARAPPPPNLALDRLFAELAKAVTAAVETSLMDACKALEHFVDRPRDPL